MKYKSTRYEKIKKVFQPNSHYYGFYWETCEYCGNKIPANNKEKTPMMEFLNIIGFCPACSAPVYIKDKTTPKKTKVIYTEYKKIFGIIIYKKKVVGYV
jgi:hypothetical protein